MRNGFSLPLWRAYNHLGSCAEARVQMDGAGPERGIHLARSEAYEDVRETIVKVKTNTVAISDVNPLISTGKREALNVPLRLFSTMHDLAVELRLARLDERATLPHRATTASAGMDLHALERTEVGRGEATLIRTGLAMALPKGWEAQIRCRSSLGRKGLIMPNGLGTIDADYRGELAVMMTWIGEGDHYVVEAGERVAQLLVAPVPQVTVTECTPEELGSTDRGAGGFGSSGRF